MKSPFSAALLMGGRSRRMGVDKAMLVDPRSGLSCWQRQLQLLESLNPSEKLVSLRDTQVNPSDWQSVTDAANDAGPLSGITACLRTTKQPLLLVLGIDLLAMRAEPLLHLIRFGCGAVYQNTEGFYEPLAAVYPRDAANSAAAFLSSGGRRLQDWIGEGVAAGWMQTVPLPSGYEADFLNVNTQEIYTKLTDS